MSRWFVPSLTLLLAQLAFAGARDDVDRALLSAGDAGATVAITRVNVIDVDQGTIARDMTVLISGGRITDVVPASRARLPSRVRALDGRGRYLIPGLWDMHTHVNDGADWFFPLSVANGVTGIRDMGSAIDRPDEWHARARRDSLAPRVVASGPIVTGMVVDTDSRLVRIADSAAAARSVDSLLAHGSDFIKVHDWLTPNAYAGVTSRARTRHVTVAGHLPVAIAPVQAAAAGQRSIEHLGNAWGGLLVYCSTEARRFQAALGALLTGDIDPVEISSHRSVREQRRLEDTYSPALAESLGSVLARHQVWLTPTLVTSSWEALRGPAGGVDSERVYLPAGLQQEARQIAAEAAAHPPSAAVRAARARTYARHLELIRTLHRQGVRLLVGTDTGPFPDVAPGFAVHRELQLLVEAGLSPAEALRAATIEPARYLDATDSLGAVRAGMAADLVLLRANPLADIRNIGTVDAVVVRGHIIDSVGRARILDDLRRRMSAPEYPR